RRRPATPARRTAAATFGSTIRDDPCRRQPEEPPMLVALAILGSLLAGALVGAVVIRTIGASRFDKALRTRQQLLQDAEREAEATRREARVAAREEAVKLRAEIEAE